MATGFDMFGTMQNDMSDSSYNIMEGIDEIGAKMEEEPWVTEMIDELIEYQEERLQQEREQKEEYTFTEEQLQKMADEHERECVISKDLAAQYRREATSGWTRRGRELSVNERLDMVADLKRRAATMHKRYRDAEFAKVNALEAHLMSIRPAWFAGR